MEHGEEESEINAGEDAGEYANRRNDNNKRRGSTGGASDGGGSVGGMGAVQAPSEVSLYPTEEDVMPSLAEDGEYSYYEESHAYYDATGDDVSVGTASARAEEFLSGSTMSLGSGGVGEGGVDGGGDISNNINGDMGQQYLDQMSDDDSDGWVDQYTNSSLSRDNLVGFSQSHTPQSRGQGYSQGHGRGMGTGNAMGQASSSASHATENWTTARLSPAV